MCKVRFTQWHLTAVTVVHLQTEHVIDIAWTQARPQVKTVEQWTRTKIHVKQAIQDKYEGKCMEEGVMWMFFTVKELTYKKWSALK